MRIERVFCPLDFSEFSERAFDYAQSLARHYHAPLLVGYVIQPLFTGYPSYIDPDVVSEVALGLRSQAEEEIEKFVKSRFRDGVQVENVVLEGNIPDQILCLAQARAVDLIVMGTHGRHGLDHLLLGSVTEKVLRKARCPVLVVRRPAHGFVAPAEPGDPVRLHKILLAIDFSSHSERALRYAISLAGEYEAELTVVHVLEVIPTAVDLATVTADVMRQLEILLPPTTQSPLPIGRRLRVGKPYEEINRYAAETNTDLIVLGVRGRNALDLALFGSTTHRVIQQGPCPVLAVHI